MLRHTLMPPAMMPFSTPFEITLLSFTPPDYAMLRRDAAITPCDEAPMPLYADTRCYAMSATPFSCFVYDDADAAIRHDAALKVMPCCCFTPIVTPSFTIIIHQPSRRSLDVTTSTFDLYRKHL